MTIMDLTEGSIGTAETQTISADPEAWVDVLPEDADAGLAASEERPSANEVLPSADLADGDDDIGEGTGQDEPETGGEA
jgi:hypothetical protein